MSTTITLKAATLERVLTNGMLFACKDSTLPSICTVRFAWDGDELLAVATNRYVLSVEHVDYEGNGNTEGRDEFSVGTGDAKRVVSLLKALRSPGFPVAVKYDSDANKVTFMIDGDTITVTGEHGQFANWRNNVPADDTGQAMEGITIATQWLGLLVKVKADYKNTPVRLSFNGSKPFQARIGEHFKAIIVPLHDPTATAAAA